MRLLGWLTLIGLIGLAAFAVMVGLLRPIGAALATESSGARQYVVQPGDTLSGIADRHRTTVAALAAVNGIKNADQIEVGQRLSVDGKVRPASRPAAPTRRPAPTRKRSPVEEPDAIVDPDFSDLLVESLVAQVRLRGYRCDSVSAAQRGLLGSKTILTCNQYRYRFVFEDRGGRLFFTVK